MAHKSHFSTTRFQQHQKLKFRSMFCFSPCVCGQDFDERPLLETHKQKCTTIEEMATPKVRVPGCLDGAKALSHRLRGREVEAIFASGSPSQRIEVNL